ncbi:MAG: hypothetical protein JXR19_03210 [Bacteroidia bacterium]
MKILEKQGWHLLSALVLVALTGYAVHSGVINVKGSLWGLTSQRWLDIAILIPIIHQLYVVLCWRYELYYKFLSKRFGANGFKLYTAGFFIIFSLRFISLIILAISNKGSFNSSAITVYIAIIVIALLGGYAMYSTARFFGMKRAVGQDHFDPSMKNVPLVKKGIFKYTNNGMYVYALTLLYLPGLIAFSSAALAGALFNHIFIWAHFYFTEKPDMKKIYGN